VVRDRPEPLAETGGGEEYVERNFFHGIDSEVRSENCALTDSATLSIVDRLTKSSFPLVGNHVVTYHADKIRFRASRNDGLSAIFDVL
jgi:hypothetical protein